MHTVVEMPEFLRRARDCGVSEDERAEIVSCVAADPKGGNLMPGTGGARKIRFARPGQGKRGSYRVIIFYSSDDIPVFLLTMYAKNMKGDVSQEEKSAFRKLSKTLPAAYARKKNG